VHYRQSLATYKIPRRVEFLELPKSSISFVFQRQYHVVNDVLEEGFRLKNNRLGDRNSAAHPSTIHVGQRIFATLWFTIFSRLQDVDHDGFLQVYGEVVIRFDVLPLRTRPLFVVVLLVSGIELANLCTQDEMAKVIESDVPDHDDRSAPIESRNLRGCNRIAVQSDRAILRQRPAFQIHARGDCD